MFGVFRGWILGRLPRTVPGFLFFAITTVSTFGVIALLPFLPFFHLAPWKKLL